ncbi:MAG: sulfur oxidation c-type cytochrome SoxA [Rhodobacterales bacterium]
MSLTRNACAAGLVALAASVAPVSAQGTGGELDVYHQMLSDPFANPAWFAVDRGEELWVTAAGPKNATLEACDLGLGAGVVAGAYAQLPRYFADVDRVMDADTRIAWCREDLQGIPFEETAKAAFSKNRADSEMQDLTMYVAAQSEEMAISIPAEHAKEKEAIAIGEELFFRRSSLLDYSCATCHSNTGARIRLQELSNLTEPEEAGPVMASWPTYRVSHETSRTMQHRMWDCQWQMRQPDIAFGSDATIALIAYMNNLAEGTPMSSPSLKR